MPKLYLRAKARRNEIVTRTVLREMRGPLVAVALFSLLINLLVLAHPLYMMNLFDRVLTSLSVDTLIALTIITAGLLAVMGILEAIRSRTLNRLSVRFDDAIGSNVFDAMFRANLHQKVGGATLLQVDQIRGFLTGSGLIAFFDLPFAPIFLAILFLLHPWLGAVALVGTIIIVLIGLSVEWYGKRPLRESGSVSRRAWMFANDAMINAEAAAALGMVGHLRKRWLSEHEAAIDRHAQVSDTLAGISGTLKAAIMLIQITVLAVACYLVILEEATPGVMFAANILAMRIVQPVNQAVSGWRSFLQAREAYKLLEDLLFTVPEDRVFLQLPKPDGQVAVEQLAGGAPSTNVRIVKGVSFQLQPGEALGVIGPSGSGKSTLARFLVGVWPPFVGSVRLDGADVSTWDYDNLGRHIGYLPQDVSLFDGSIAENICRFGPRNDSEIIAAAQAADLHEVILRQPDGYDTQIRSRGGILSGGQRQRLALARALYGNPSLIVLDEPNSNLDGDGEQALLKTIGHLKQQGKTLIIIAHNPRVIQSVDKVLLMRDGKLAAFGGRLEVLSKLKVVSSKQEPVRLEGPKEAAAGGGDA